MFHRDFSFRGLKVQKLNTTGDRINLMVQIKYRCKIRCSGQAEKLDAIKMDVLCCSIKVKVVHQLDTTHLLSPIKDQGSLVRSRPKNKLGGRGYQYSQEYIRRRREYLTALYLPINTLYVVQSTPVYV